jgi:hypothetical protein
MPTLCLMFTRGMNTLQMHSSIDSVNPSPGDVPRAVVKVKLFTGQYLPVEAHHSRWKKQPTCPLCRAENVDIVHFLLKCPTLEHTRLGYLHQMDRLASQYYSPEVWSAIQASTSVYIQCIMDPSVLIAQGYLPHVEDFLCRIEMVTRQLCYSLHCRRAHIICGDITRGAGGKRSIPMGST